MANKRFTATELDFDAIKTNLKTFLQGQSQFSDYNFEGSSLSQLLNILAYNTHYNALYYNMAINESFLDSASKRNSIVSHAKLLGYVPRSAKCATAIINFSNNSPTGSALLVTLPKYSKFTTKIDNVDYAFYTLESVTAVKNGSGNFVFSGLKIYEGTPLTYNLSYTSQLKFTIPNRGVDSDTIVVKVQQSGNSGVYDVFKEATSILEVDGTSQVYFLKEVENELLEIEFGNGVLGVQLDVGQSIIIEYLVSSKTLPNGAKSFSYTSSLGQGGTYSIVCTSPASGGADVEDQEEIRFFAPKYFASQNRAVTEIDYETLIKYNYADIDSISVWGGETNNPPVYGKVYICIKPVSSTVLTKSQKDSIATDILKKRNIVSVTPVFVDPNYLNIEVNTTVYYDETRTAFSANDIKTNAIQVIKDFTTNNLNSFNKVFKFSVFGATIDKTDDSVVSNITLIKIHRPVTVLYGVSNTYEINIENPIYNSGYPEEALLSTGFYVTGNSTDVFYLDDDGVGNIRLYTLVGGNKNITNHTAGTVDYSTGVISIRNLSIDSIASTDFELIIKPYSNDVVSSKNNIVTIPDDLINVTAIPDPSTSGNTNYVWAASR